MSLIDLPLLAQMILAFLVIATLDSPAPKDLGEEIAPEECVAPAWTPKQDLHAQRILRLESLRGESGTRP